MTPDSFDAEFMCEWKHDEHAAFSGVEHCIEGPYDDDGKLVTIWDSEWYDAAHPMPNREYWIGADFGKKKDYSVQIVLDVKSMKVVGYWRRKYMDYDLVDKHLAGLAHKYNHALVIADTTQYEERIVKNMQKYGVRLKKFKFTSKSKPKLIEHLILLVQRGEIKFPKIRALVKELEKMREEKSGNTTKYQPPTKNDHDDCVDTLALAAWGKKLKSRQPYGANRIVRRGSESYIAAG
jgi:hypothetical protein